MKIFIILSSVAVIICSCITNKNYTQPKGKYWVNSKYIECVKNNLPCECEDLIKTSFAIILDTNSNSENFGLKYKKHLPPNEYLYASLKKFPDGSYTIIETKNDKEYITGKLIIKNDSLFVIDTNNLKEIYINNLPQSVYKQKFTDKNYFYFYNAYLLKSTFNNKGLPSHKSLFSSNTLTCWCNATLYLNIISNSKKEWIIELNNDSIYFYDYLNSRNRDPFSKEVLKELYKKYLWSK